MMQSFQLNNGNSIPALGLGTWKSAPGEVKAAVKEAIKVGYRHIDCAFIYGNEKEIGEALYECFKDGLVKRDDLFITSKLWNNSKSPDDVLPALKKTLSDLQLDYVDMYLIHWPVILKKGVEFPKSGDEMLYYDDIPIERTWAELERAVEQGLTKGIGVSNFSVKKLTELLEKCTKIPPAICQVELHPYWQQPDLVAFCQQKGIHVTAYSGLGSNDRPDFVKKAGDPILLDDPVINEIAKKHGATPAQVVLKYEIQYGVSTIPKSTNAGRIKQNFETMNVTLDEQDMEQIKKLNSNRRLLDGAFWCTIEGSPYTLENLWDE